VRSTVTRSAVSAKLYAKGSFESSSSIVNTLFVSPSHAGPVISTHITSVGMPWLQDLNPEEMLIASGRPPEPFSVASVSEESTRV
jgi:hypothetical protein